MKTNCACGCRQKPEKNLKFGRYDNCPSATYKGYFRSSDYLPLSDGTKLAYDLLLPKEKGKVTKKALPTILIYTPYLRAFNMVKDGKLIADEIFKIPLIFKFFILLRAKLKKNGNIFDFGIISKLVKRLLNHGYAIVIVEQRGTGASEGVVSLKLKDTANDINDTINWIAEQPWSNKKIGMIGKSFMAINQYIAASTKNRHLKALFPVSASFDIYNAIAYPGGIFNTAFIKTFEKLTRLLEKMAVPVDEDKDDKKLNKILEKRKGSLFPNIVVKLFKENPYRNNKNKDNKAWEETELYSLLNEINASKIPIYNATGWFDFFTRDTILWDDNLTVKKKLYIKPYSHFAIGHKKDLDYLYEAHKWFDYWLKGVDNGIIDEPPVHYFTIGESSKLVKTPPLKIEKTQFYFNEKGLLTKEKPENKNEYDLCKQNPSSTTGTRSRWGSIAEDCNYPKTSEKKQGEITYASLPLKEDLEITGSPIVEIFTKTTAKDFDLFVYLEEVDNKGNAIYVTEGCLRTSHRAVSNPPFYNLDIPFHPSGEEDLKTIEPDKETKMSFDLLPTSKLFRKGNKIQIRISLTDHDNFETLKLDTTEEIKILRNSNYPSVITLPMTGKIKDLCG